jgi:hypothetical protein
MPLCNTREGNTKAEMPKPEDLPNCLNLLRKSGRKQIDRRTKCQPDFISRKSNLLWNQSNDFDD